MVFGSGLSLGAKSLGLMVWSLKFGPHGFELRVQCLGMRVLGWKFVIMGFWTWALSLSSVPGLYP